MHHVVRASAHRVLALVLISFVLAGCGARHTATSTIPRAANAAIRHARTIAEAAYPNQILAYTPLAYYRLNDTSSTLVDSSPNHFNGTYGTSVSRGQAGLVPTNGDGAAAFPGGAYSANSIASVPANATLQPGSVTVEAWVKESAAQTSEVDIAAYGKGGSIPGVVYSLRISASNTFLAYFVTPTGRIAVTGTTVLTPGQAYFAAAAYDGNTATLYVNGNLEGATSNGGGSLSYTGSGGYGLGLGDSVGSTVLPVFNGVIDDVAIFGLALSGQEIQDQYTAGTTLPTSTNDPYGTAVMSDAPAAYYRLDDGGSALVDATTNHLNGTYGASVTEHATGLLQSTADLAAQFLGGTYTADKIATVTANSLLEPSSVSAEAWVTESAATTTERDIIAYGKGGSIPGVVYSLRLSTSNTFLAYFVLPSGRIAVTGTTVLTPGVPYYAIATYDGTTAKLYVNGVLEATTTAGGALSYAGSSGYGLGIGDSVGSTTLPVFAGTIDEVAVYPTALSASRVSAHYAAGTGAPPATTVWQTGNGTLGQFDSDVSGCSNTEATKSVSGQNISFTILRNSNTSYDYNGTTYPGASTCYRNQINPIDANTGTNFLLAMGAHYTFTFQTVVTFNGNYTFQGASDGGLAVDVPAIVWQTHSYGGDGSPCDLLVIQNTYRAYQSGSTEYGTVSPGGLPTWNFHTCDESDFTGAAYNSPDTLFDGEVDTWKIDMVAQLQGQNGGSIVVSRNGTVVYNAASHACDPSTPECFWNFGPYMFYWVNSEKPSNWNNAGVTVQFNNMTLVKH